ncbi:hypothetical protein FGRMN_8405 [Fusarium graminum]|nr:hypothetical protein FGRMN_8405 [Fusarium graminum]
MLHSQYVSPNSFLEVAGEVVIASFERYTSKYCDPSDTGTGSKLSLGLAKQWLDDCCESHVDCRLYCATQTSILPTRVIDLEPMNTDKDPILLVTNGQRAPYVALSYCWGGASFIKTSDSNLQQQQQGIPIGSLPKTFRDAIVITKALGVGYLWIDSICIIQGPSKTDWGQEAQNMRHYYRNALVTICAQGSSDPFGSCFAQRDASTRRPIFLPSCNEEGVSYVDSFWSRDIPNPSPKGPLDTRAWTLQEQVLSGRILSYCEGTVFWKCVTSKLREAKPYMQVIPKEACHPDLRKFVINYESGSFEWGQKAGPADFKKLVVDYESQPIVLGQPTAISNRQAIYDAWYNLMDDYWQRELTYATDKLVAISALAEQMSSMLDDEYVCGLWRKDMIHGMLWWTIKGHEVPNVRSPYNGEGFVAPSWSWASIKSGRVGTWRERESENCLLGPRFSAEVDDQKGHKNEGDIEILDIRTTSIGNSFGQVRSGSIRLKGYVKEYICEPGDGTLYECESSYIIGGFNSDESLRPQHERIKIKCLYVCSLSVSSEDEDQWRDRYGEDQRFWRCACLGIVATELQDGEYYRVGMAMIDYWKWDEGSKREILLS